MTTQRRKGPLDKMGHMVQRCFDELNVITIAVELKGCFCCTIALSITSASWLCKKLQELALKKSKLKYIVQKWHKKSRNKRMNVEFYFQDQYVATV